MRRRFLTALSFVSLLLCVAVCVLWVRSLRHVDVLGYEGEVAGAWQRGGYVSSADGVVGCQWWVRQSPPASHPPVTGWRHTEWPIRSGASLLKQGWRGFSYDAGPVNNFRPASNGRATPRYMGFSHQVTAPHWALLLAMLTPVALWLGSTLRRRRSRPEMQCRKCGYDLRATPDRCPECGKAVPKAGTPAEASLAPTAPAPGDLLRIDVMPAE